MSREILRNYDSEIDFSESFEKKYKIERYIPLKKSMLESNLYLSQLSQIEDLEFFSRRERFRDADPFRQSLQIEELIEPISKNKLKEIFLDKFEKYPFEDKERYSLPLSPFFPREYLSLRLPAVDPIPLLPETERLKLAAQRRAEKLRNPHLKALLRFVRATPHIWDQINQFQKKKDRLLEGTRQGLENHRTFAPILAAIAVNPEARSYMQVALDEAAKLESDTLKHAAETNGGLFVPILVIGAGVHGAVFNSQLLYERPDIRVLTVDQEDKLGGNFRRSSGPAFRTNSRNRAEDRGEVGLPGQDGNINSMGAYATLQVSDATYETYATNDTFGLVAALNQYLSSDTMLSVKVTEVTRNKKGKNGEYAVFLEDRNTGEKYIVRADTVVVASGLGEQNFGLDLIDEMTQDILKAEIQIAKQGDEMPRVLTSDSFFSIVSDRENQFPLEAFVGKKIAVIGGKDSGNTVIEYLVGLGPEYRGSVAQLGKPESINWIGPEFKTKEEFEECIRLRYAQIGLFLPKKPGKQALVNPRAEKATRLIRGTDGKILVVSVNKEDRQTVEEYDYVILATGYTDKRDKVFKEITGRDFESTLTDVNALDKRFNRITAARRLIGEEIYFVGPSARIPVDDFERFATNALTIPENSAAIWRYTEKTAATARNIGSGIKTKTSEGLDLKPFRYPEGALVEEDKDIMFAMEFDVLEKMFAPEIDYSDLLSMQAMSMVGGIGSVTFNVKIDSQSKEGVLIRVHPLGAAPEEEREWLERFLSTTTTQRLLGKLARSLRSVNVHISAQNEAISPYDVNVTRAKN